MKLIFRILLFLAGCAAVYGIIRFVNENTARLEGIPRKELVKRDLRGIKTTALEIGKMLYNGINRVLRWLIRLFAPGPARYIFGVDLFASLNDVINEYRFQPFAAEAYQTFRDRLPLLYVSFVQRTAFTDEVADEVLLHLEEVFRRYLQAYGLPFNYEAYRFIDGATIYVYIYYAETANDLHLLREKHNEMVRFSTTPGFGTLQDALYIPKKDSAIPVGYYAEKWQQSGRRVPVLWDYKTTPSILICGHTGSGKTVLARSIVYSLLYRGANVSICDYKGADDWKGLGYSYATGNDCAQLFEEFYDTFQKIRSRGKPAIRPQVLVIDEYQSFSMSYQATEGAKAFADFMKKLSDIALMGRAYNCRLVLITQQMSSKCADTVVREQLGIKIYLGRKISEETRGMLFPGCEIDMAKSLPKYHGFISTPDNELDLLAVPEITNLSEWEAYFHDANVSAD